MADGQRSMGCPPPQCVTHKDGQLQRGEQAPFAAYFTHDSRELKMRRSTSEKLPSWASLESSEAR
jgi:hypothetical protein